VENYSLLLFQSSGIGINYFLLVLSQSFGIGEKFPQIIATFLQQFFIYIIIFAIIWLFWGKNAPTLMHKIFNNKYFIDK